MPHTEKTDDRSLFLTNLHPYTHTLPMDFNANKTVYSFICMLFIYVWMICSQFLWFANIIINLDSSSDIFRTHCILNWRQRMPFAYPNKQFFTWNSHILPHKTRCNFPNARLRLEVNHDVCVLKAFGKMIMIFLISIRNCSTLCTFHSISELPIRWLVL